MGIIPEIRAVHQSVFIGRQRKPKRGRLEEKKACSQGYYARISEVDGMIGRLLDILDASEQRENTIVLFMSDHGQLNWAHGLLSMNIGCFEELYGIPMILSGPGIARNSTTTARVGLHDLCPTLLELAGAAPIPNPDSTSFAPLLSNPAAGEKNYQNGYAEYFGGRYRLSQRVVWAGRYKFVHNGFDYDELYDLQNDPAEMTNLYSNPAYESVRNNLLSQMWKTIKKTGDNTLYHTHFPTTRLAALGPEA